MISIEGLTVTYGQLTPIADLSLTMGDGSTALMGPSGSGKSTLLRVLAGQQAPAAGAVTIDGSPVRAATWTQAGDPRIALVHQDYRLVPFLSVRDNLLLAAELRGVAPSQPVEELLEQMSLLPSLADRMPAELSGGQQQRVAIARALVTDARVILADEPTGALDAETSARIAELLARIGRRDGLTVVVATHDRAMADTLDRVVDLGRLLQAAA